MELDEKFLKEFKDVYQAVNIIGTEVFKLKEQVTKLSTDLAAIRADIAMAKGDLQFLRAKTIQSGQRPEFSSSAPAQNTTSSQGQGFQISQPQAAQQEQGQGQQPAAQQAKEEPRRLRTGQFQPGDKHVDIANVFYYGNKK